MNLDTLEGMEAAKLWTSNTLNMLKDGGVWAVPRSGVIVTIISHKEKTLTISAPDKEPSVVQVIEQLGWRFV